MIRIYIQYSFGGFKTFLVDGVKEEHMNKEVTQSDMHGFNSMANIYFSRSGVKLAYHALANHEFTLAIREIPSPHKDDSGRAMNCAIQFIGSNQDRLTLDNMAIAITNNITYFEKFIHDLFYVDNGLRIDGDRLRDYVNAFTNRYDYVGDVKSPILNIRNHTGIGIILFVSESSNFTTSKEVRNTVLRNLSLSDADFKQTVIITFDDLKLRQNKIQVKEAIVNSSLNSEETNNKKLEKKNTEIVVARLDENTDNLRLQLTKLQEELNATKFSYANLKKEYATIQQYSKYLLMTVAGCILIILLMIIF